ncbi:MAG: carboxypeptidase-like regulatory domain-containing protein [Candidatus Bathyarchaeia archaeon]
MRSCIISSVDMVLGLETYSTILCVTGTFGPDETVTGNYKTQYRVTFAQSGSAVAPKVTYSIDGGASVQGTVEFSVWVDKYSSIAYSYQNPVPNGLYQYWLSSVTPPSPIESVNSPITVTGYYLKLPYSAVTTSSLCYFDADKDPNNGQQFRLIFTQDPTSPSTYKLTASNPGQFYYNVFYVGTPSSSVTLKIKIPYPFVTQGSQPIHIYSGVKIVDGCFIPSGELSVFAISGTSTTTPSGALGIALSDYANGFVEITISGTVPDSGLVYVTVHLDYGLKKTVGYTPDGDKNAQHSTTPITNGGSYAFSYATFDGSTETQIDTQTIKNENVFKRDPGFAGIVTDSSGNPIQGVEVKIYGPDGKLLATVCTDEDGWYFFNYKHTGKEATYRIVCNGISIPVKLKANQLAQIDFPNIEN